MTLIKLIYADFLKMKGERMVGAMTNGESGILSTIKLDSIAEESHWISGTYGDNIGFTARHYDEPSAVGINEGRTKTLYVFYKDGSDIACYDEDKGWTREPQNEYQQTIVDDIVGYLKKVPPRAELRLQFGQKGEDRVAKLPTRSSR